jgi:transcriptional regulator with XRE-family HTH domain
VRTFNDASFFAAVEERRRSEGVSWRQLGRQLGLSPSTFSRLARGRSPDVETFTKLLAWLDVSASTFITGANQGPAREPDAMAVITAALRTDPKLSPEAAGALEEIMRVAYNRFRRSN